ncbi:hypothetical protein [Veillonella montpellierensis]|nr:hypothetical protein [Veillonella montpellierensis]
MEQKELRMGILQLIYNEGFKFLARDKDNRLYVYTKRPKKKDEYWDSVGILERLKFSDELFADIRFEDKEPLNIAEEIGILDWSTIPKDTKVLVSSDNKHWKKAHFAGFDEKGTNKFIVYGFGETSWTANSRIYDFKVDYKYCKLGE